MSNVVQLNAPYYGDIPVEKVIQGTTEANLKEIVVLGTTQDGERFYASSIGDYGAVHLLLLKAQRDLLEMSG